MSNYLVLGFRALYLPLSGPLSDAVRESDPSSRVTTFASRRELILWLKESAGIPRNEELEVPPSFESTEIRLFVCSTVTREGSTDGNYNDYDGYDFAQRVLPKTPSLIAHFQNRQHYSDIRMEIPNDRKLLEDWSRQVFHAPYDLSYREQEKTRQAVSGLVGLILKKDFHPDFAEYMDIIEKFRRSKR